MAYKILYIEDLNPGSIVHDLKTHGFEAEHYNPESLDELLVKAKDCDLLLLDFRLTENNKVQFDAPTIAQTIRTIGSTAHMIIPIVLISSETKIADYYKDYSSQGLFDFSVSKEDFLECMPKFSKRFISVIEAYKVVVKNKKSIPLSLGVSEDKMVNLDYRIIEKLKSEMFKDDVFAFNNFILNNIIRSIGVLIGEDVLSARLGVSRASEEWPALRQILDAYKYAGIYSGAYDRWWSFEIDNWWKANNDTASLRRLNALQRVERLKEITKLNKLVPKEKTLHASSSNFWTICKHSKRAIDSIDGLELYQRDLFPWQEKEYVSIHAGLEGSPLTKYIKPADMVRLRDISKSIEKK